MRTLPGASLLFIVSFVAAACGGGGPTASPSPTVGPSPSAQPTPSPSAEPTPSPSVGPSPSVSPEADIAVVRIGQTGGFMAPWITLNNYPTVALYADGRLITTGPQIEIYPGPALPNLQVTQLTLNGVDQVLVWAADAGLQGEDRFLGQPMPDAGVTTFVVDRLDGSPPHTTSVADLSAADQETGAVRRFQEILLSIREWLPNDVIGDDQAYGWSSLQIISVPADAASQPDPQFVTVSDWPLADLASAGIPIDAEGGHRCGLVEPTDADVLRPLLAASNELTLWRSEGRTYMVQFHPLWPDDVACPGFAGP